MRIKIVLKLELKSFLPERLLMKEKLVKQRYDLESWITLMLVSSEESFIICIGRIFLPV